MSEEKGCPLKRSSEKEEEDEEEAVTMLDVLKDSEELEEDAKRLLGGTDDSNCTYLSQGYAKRQALYACVTCTNPVDSVNGKLAGICVGCSYHCHEGHELIELYTKRNFRCDCGNSKFKDVAKCKIYDKKEHTNEKNAYNQNYKGSYCTCGRPYPDPDETVSDEMIQCVICEDWLHGRHLDLSPEENLPKGGNYDDMICSKCCSNHWKDLWMFYEELFVPSSSQENESIIEVEEPRQCPRSRAGDCKITRESKTLFMSPGWRLGLCKCETCKEIYKKNNLDYLIDPEDTMSYYESKSLEKTGDSYEEGLKALSSLDRVKQVEAISSYNTMKTDLMDYLKTFAQGGKIVTSDDIKQFFQKMNGAKRQRITIPEFCK